MSISEYNYEAYFLDYHEGKLDGAAIQELMDFIARHPELQEEFESFEEIKLTDNFDEVKFEHKDLLKKVASAVNANTFDEIAVQYVEGTLNAPLTAELLEFVKQNPKYESELALYSKTKLVADNSIVFENKDSLKRTSRRTAAAYYYWSAAASVAIIAGIYLFFNAGKQPATSLVVHNNHAVDTVHTITKPQQPVQNNSVVNNNIASTNNDARQPRKHYSVKRTVNNNFAVQQTPVPNNVIAVQNNAPVVQKHDTNIVVTNNLAANAPKDFDVNKSLVQQPAVVNPPANNDTEQTKGKSVFAFVSNTVKNVGKVIKRNFGVNKYYSKDTDKVIAYQVTLGDNRITIPLKYNAY